MGLLDDFIARISSRRGPTRAARSLSTEDDEKVKEIMSMFADVERQTIIEVLFEHDKNFEETVEVLLKRGAPSSDESTVTLKGEVIIEPDQRAPAEVEEPEVANEEGEGVDEGESGSDEPIDALEELEPAQPNEPFEPAEDEFPAPQEDTSAEIREEIDETQLLQARLSSISREFEEKRAKLLQKLKRKEERRKRKVLNDRPRMIELDLHIRMITQLQREKEQVEQQKRKAMEWCLAQMAEIQRQNQLQKLEIDRQGEEMDELRSQLVERESQLAKMEGLLQQSASLLEEYGCGTAQSM